MSSAILALPPHLRARLRTALESGILAAPSRIVLSSQLGLGDQAEAILLELQELDRKGVRGPAAAAWIGTLDEALASRSRPDLVWSGPKGEGLHSRDTRAVYEELLGNAKRSVWVSSYAFFDGPRAFNVLARRMEEVPDLDATLLLNIQRGKGDTSRSEEVIRRFAERFWEKDWPGTRRPRVLFDPRSLEEDGPQGVLHAKAVVADIERVFVTSANLTEAAFDRNLEMGILLRDRTIALNVIRHFEVLISRGLLVGLPGK